MLNLNEMENMNKKLLNEIQETKEEFNSSLIKKDIKEANENTNKNVTNCLNLVATNKLTRNYVLKDPRVQEYMTLSREGYTSIVRGIHSQDVNFAKLNGFDCMDNNGNIFTADMLNTKGYDLDHILPYEYLLAPENEDLLADIVISYDGNIEKAFDDLMTRNSKNFMFVTEHINRSKGGKLGSSMNCKYSQLTDEQKAKVRAEYLKREETAKAEATKNTKTNMTKGKINQLKDTLKNMVVVAVIKMAIRAITNKIMEIAGELMFKSINKKWYDVLKDACCKDAIKKLCNKFYETFRNIKDTVKNGIAKFIDSFKDGKSFATKIIESIKKLTKNLGAMVINLVLGISKLVLKAIQLAWSVCRLIKEATKALKSNKNNKNYGERLNAAKEVAYSISSSLIDCLDFVIEIIITVVFKGINISAWIMPLINTILTVLCSILSFMVAIFIDTSDYLMVNSSNRVKYVTEKLF